MTFPKTRKLAVQAVTALIIFAVAAIIIALRRPDQIRNPEVWNEDGLFIIPQILQAGFSAVFLPVNGYLILPSRLITWAALQFPLEIYPFVSTIIGLTVQAACVASIACAPSYLRWPAACALVTCVLPMNAEVYLLPQYSFWWTTLLLFLALIWKTGERPVTRTAFAIIGGFSTPLVAPIAALFVLRLAVTRSWKDDLPPTIAVCIIAAIQMSFVAEATPRPPQEIASVVATAASVFFGGFTIFGGTYLQPVAALIVLAIITSTVVFTRGMERLSCVLLLLTLVATIAATLTRVPIDAIFPTLNGPRYFFLPLVIVAWLLLYAAAAKPPLTLASALAFLLCVPVTYLNFARSQEPLRPWRDAVAECRSHGAEMPVQHDGNRVNQHRVGYEAFMCK